LGEDVLPGHQSLDFVADVGQNATEVRAYYLECNGDMECTLHRLQQFNPSWRFIVKHKGKEQAYELIKKNLADEK
jgi:hypothetical protein